MRNLGVSMKRIFDGISIRRILGGNPRNTTLKDKVLASVVLIFIFQALSALPTPFTNPDYVKTVLEGNQSLGLYNALTGRGFSNLSLMTLSITPYITASIVLQLLAVAVKPISDILTDNTRSGAKKRWKLNSATSAALALTQGVAMAVGYGKQGIVTNTWYAVLTVSLYWTLGTSIAVLFGWLISEKVLGKGNLNGVSLILLSNILSSYLVDVESVRAAILLRDGGKGVKAFITIIVIITVICVFAFVTLGQLCAKKIEVSQSKKIAGGYNAPKTNFTIKLWSGSVVPVIFAAQIYSMPSIIRTVAGKDWMWVNFFNTSAWFDVGTFYYTVGAIGYVLLIIGFSYYYTDISVNIYEVAENFKKGGYYISGIRPGKPTANYLRAQMKYVIFIGGVALSIIALIPCIVSGTLHIQGIAFLGTSLLITVGVILDIRDYILSQTRYNVMSAYKKGGFLNV